MVSAPMPAGAVGQRDQRNRHARRSRYPPRVERLVGDPARPGCTRSVLARCAGARDAWDDLQLFGALMPDLYEVLLRPGVSR